MKILNLKDNALFLQNWRERMRLASAASAALLALVIVLLIFTNAFLNESYTYEYKHTPVETVVDGENRTTYTTETIRTPVPWLNEAFWQLAIFQGFILILFGTLSADRMAIRENSSGTLDFHRSSPTPVINQYLGLLFGATSLEWCVFFGTLAVSAVLVPMTSITLTDFVRFYGSLMLTAILYHSLAVLLAISAGRQQVLAHRRFGALQLLFALFIFSGLCFEGFELSTFYHLTWYPPYDHLSQAARDVSILGGYDSSWAERKIHVMYSFFGYPISPGILQCLAQFPLLLFFFIGIVRKLKNPQRPVFSKFHTAMLALIILFLFVGSAYTVIIYGTSNYSYESPLKDLLPVFMILFIGLGGIGCMSATPTKLQFLKGLVRNQKLGLKRLNLNDDHSSNLLWLLTYCVVFSGMYYLLGFTFLTNPVHKWLCLAILLSYMIFFAMGLEYFRLGRHRKQMPLFWTGLAVLWFVLPMFVSVITSSTGATQRIYFAMVAPSPFWTMDLLTNILSGHALYGTNVACCLADSPQKIGCFPDLNTNLLSVLAVNAVLAGVATLLAWQVRRRIKMESLKDFPAQNQP